MSRMLVGATHREHTHADRRVLHADLAVKTENSPVF
jgi:hypothetical protein